MQLAHEMKKRRMLLRARWVPRLRNREADDLTDDEIRHFQTESRIQVDLVKFGFNIMDELFSADDADLEELEKARTSMKRRAESRSARDIAVEMDEAKRRRPLRETDPWG